MLLSTLTPELLLLFAIIQACLTLESECSRYRYFYFRAGAGQSTNKIKDVGLPSCSLLSLQQEGKRKVQAESERERRSMAEDNGEVTFNHEG